MKPLFIKALLASFFVFCGGLNLAFSSDKEIDEPKTTLARRPPSTGFSDLCFLLSRKVHPAVEAVEGLLNSIRSPYDSDLRPYIIEASAYIYQKLYGSLDREVIGDNKALWQSLLKHSPIRPFSISEVEAEFEKFTGRLHYPGKLVFHCVEGVDVQKIQHSPLTRFGILQVTSQFNFLSSSKPEYTPVPGYLEDASQGSRASLSFLSLLLVRDYLFRKPGVQQSLQPLFADLPSAAYSWGHLIPAAIPQDQRPAFIKKLKEDVDSLNIFVEWSDQSEFGGEDEPLLQIFTAAPSFPEKAMTELDSFEHQVYEALVPAQYRATAQLAVLKSLGLHGRLPLHLMLEQEVPETAMKQAFQVVYEVAGSCPIDVYIHGANADAGAMVRRNLPEGAKSRHMTATEFFAGSL